MNLVQPSLWNQAQQTLEEVWGYSAFRPSQAEVVQSLLAQRDSLSIMPTGGGKSICFQLPALLQPGLTLVVSPLVALMENQVQELQQRRLPAALLHSELPIRQRKQTLWALEQQKLRLLYLSPETLLSPAVWERICQPNLKINSLVLDEAHCLAQWGDSFRPAYYRLGAVRPALLRTKPPGTRIAIATFTATADPQAQKTIQHILQLRQPQVFRCNPYRDNLHLLVKTAWTPRGRKQQLLQFIQARPQQAGLVYVRTRRDSESLVTWLQQEGYATTAYHAGLSPEERRAIEQAWLHGHTQFVICTSAFGLGINKPDCRWVIHFHVPFLLSEYVQEIGRAGRDGEPAIALTLVSEPTGWLDSGDKQRRQFFADKLRSQQQIASQLIHKLPRQGTVEAVSRQFPDGAIALSLLQAAGQLRWQDPFHYAIASTSQNSTTLNQLQTQAITQMTDYLGTRQCRWQFLLSAFGFAAEATNLRCGHCDRCQG
ncbi:ATP-dependent DNA helicase RecQ [Trichocoleus sp. FACHB-262]|uniref:RecQ family ATP-dependent DNA helicase n=1 Tax=Trichocoleus sp. FACHB-262 TaxID=2692869 RepID=UPI001685FC31|nr:ATP-dependent DNA helicase RecQ [Trichocoleus sp. FACHB-262]MBD2124073.1 ATP-dependent DNA helicase RecQ [Trichocoleus sp. FACHB-262]